MVESVEIVTLTYLQYKLTGGEKLAKVKERNIGGGMKVIIFVFIFAIFVQRSNNNF